MKSIIVAIDGYSSCGKSTVAKALAKYAGYTYVDTGAMYRATALYALRLLGDEALNREAVLTLLPDIHIDFVQTSEGQHVTLNGEDVESLIRTLEVGNMASQISTIKEVRAFLVAQQQAMGDKKGIVMDGRDIGTVVFPDAELKIYMTADAMVRAERRYKELTAKGDKVSLEEIYENVVSRDKADMSRAISPLRKADDAIVLDNSHMSVEEQMAWFDREYQRVVGC